MVRPLCRGYSTARGALRGGLACGAATARPSLCHSEGRCTRGARRPCHGLHYRHLNIHRRRVAAASELTRLSCMFSRCGTPVCLFSSRSPIPRSASGLATPRGAAGLRVGRRRRRRRRWLCSTTFCSVQHQGDVVALLAHGDCTNFLSEEDGATEREREFKGTRWRTPNGRCRGSPPQLSRSVKLTAI